jgi:dTDP-4-dehydrorhamnose reductase
MAGYLKTKTMGVIMGKRCPKKNSEVFSKEKAGKVGKLKILILGREGMLGSMASSLLKSNNRYNVSSWDRKKLDAKMSAGVIEKILKKENPNIIVNCIGLINIYSNKKGAELDAKKINTDFPHLLAYLSIKNNFKLIHISTDCYLDKDTYGRSKYLGEINDRTNLTIRTSIIGPEIKGGFGLFDWFMSASREVSGYTKSKWDGVTTFQLIKFIEFCIEKKFTGILDYRSRKSTSKYKLLKLINKIFDKGIKINRDNRRMEDKRNKNPNFFCNKSHKIQLIEMRDFMKNKNKYEKYF